jgi:hypothetical protein
MLPDLFENESYKSYIRNEKQYVYEKSQYQVSTIIEWHSQQLHVPV